LLAALEVEPLMTASTTANLRRILRDWPDPKQDAAGDNRKLPGWWEEI